MNKNTGEPSYAERLLAHVEDFAKRCGWSKESGEGAFECVQRTSYAQGVEDGKLQRTWAGLTAEDVHNTEGYEETREMYRFARAIEAKLKAKNERLEKNT